MHAAESWLERLQVARTLVNHRDFKLSQRAIAVCSEVLNYGRKPWRMELGNTVRTQAAGVFGALEPLYRAPGLIVQIRNALEAENVQGVRNEFYYALLNLTVSAEAPEP